MVLIGAKTQRRAAEPSERLAVRLRLDRHDKAVTVYGVICWFVEKKGDRIASFLRREGIGALGDQQRRRT